MKLSLYALMLCGTISTLSYGMDNKRSSSRLSLEQLLAEIEAATSQEAPSTQITYKFPAVAESYSVPAPKKANTMTVQEVCRLTLYAIAQKQLGAPKKK